MALAHAGRDVAKVGRGEQIRKGARLVVELTQAGVEQRAGAGIWRGQIEDIGIHEERGQILVEFFLRAAFPRTRQLVEMLAYRLDLVSQRSGMFCSGFINVNKYCNEIIDVFLSSF